MKSSSISDIDFVITWVDGSDKKWLAERKKYAALEDQEIDNSEARFRDWDLLRYWFRSVEENAPWVRKIHFVTYGHIPEWLNTKHPKLHIVKHEDFIDKKYLPTFNSCAIEINLHKIPGLSEKFVYFNDDMFLNKPLLSKTFFKNNQPRNSYVLTKMSAKNQAARLRNNCNKIAAKYGKISPKIINPKNGLLMPVWNVLKLKEKPLGYISKHSPASYVKKSFEELWQTDKSILETVSSHKFRTDSDCSQWLFEYYQLYKTISQPRTYRVSKYYDLSAESADAARDISNRQHALICLNDIDDNQKKFAKAQKILKHAFRTRYPEKSYFENDRRSIC